MMQPVNFFEPDPTAIGNAASVFQMSMGQDLNDVNRHNNLIVEEMGEFHEAYSDFLADPCRASAKAVLKELSDFLYVTLGSQSVHDQLDEELVAACAMTLERVDPSIFPAYLAMESTARVHESNMSKLDDSGNPVIREEDGKVLKGPNYQPPYLNDLAAAVMVLWQEQQQ